MGAPCTSANHLVLKRGPTWLVLHKGQPHGPEEGPTWSVLRQGQPHGPGEGPRMVGPAQCPEEGPTWAVLCQGQPHGPEERPTWRVLHKVQPHCPTKGPTTWYCLPLAFYHIVFEIISLQPYHYSKQCLPWSNRINAHLCCKLRKKETTPASLAYEEGQVEEGQ